MFVHSKRSLKMHEFYITVGLHGLFCDNISMEEKKPDDNLNQKPIRTYQGDVEKILKEGDGSLAKIAIAENDKRIHGGIDLAETETPTHTKFIVGISVGLIILGIGTLATIYVFRNIKKGSVNIVDSRSIIAADLEKSLDIQGLDREQIIAALAHELDKNTAKLSSVVAIKLTEGKGEQASPIGAEEFIAKLQSHAPNELIRSLESNFMFGIHVLSKNQPFLILKTSYYQNAFAGMLSWEKSLRDDLGPLFIPPEPTVAALTSDQVLDKNVAFEDAVVKNRDARVLRGNDNKIVFLYSFSDKNTIIIATNADTLEKVTARLLAGKLVQ